MEWYKHDIMAYRRHTHGLSMLEDCAYRRLLEEYYSLHGPLPSDIKLLYEIARARTKKERVAVQNVAEKYFPTNGDGFRHNDRADKELADYESICNTNRRIARERSVARTVNEASTDRSPITRIQDNKKTNEACNAYLENGQKCGKPSDSKLGSQWLCREHHPYMKKS